MSTAVGKLRLRHQTAIANNPAYDISASVINDSLVMGSGDMGADGNVMVRDSTQTDGWGWQTVPGLITPVTVSEGGTGLATVAAGGLVYGNGTSALVVLAAVAAGQVLVSGSAPAWSASPTLSGVNILFAIGEQTVWKSLDTGGGYIYPFVVQNTDGTEQFAFDNHGNPWCFPNTYAVWSTASSAHNSGAHIKSVVAGGLDTWIMELSTSDQWIMQIDDAVATPGANVEWLKVANYQNTPLVKMAPLRIGGLASGPAASPGVQLGSVVVWGDGANPTVTLDTRLTLTGSARPLIAFSDLTSGSPGLAYSGTTLQARLGDDSAAAPFSAAQITASRPNIQSTATDGLTLANTTASTNPVQVQRSPRLVFHAQVWNGSADETSDWQVDNLPSGAATPTSQLNFNYSRNGGGATTPVYFTNTGFIVATRLYAAAYVMVQTAIVFAQGATSEINAPADGQLNFVVNAENVGVGFDFSTDGVCKFRTRAQNAYATVDALAYKVSGTAGIDASITTAALIGKTITVSKGIITGFV